MPLLCYRKTMLTKNRTKHDGAFLEPPIAPIDDNLKAMLGQAFPVLEELLTALHDIYPDIIHDWMFSHRAGWYQIWLLNSHRLFYLMPKRGEFQLNLLLGERAIAAMQNGPYARQINALVAIAKRYPEGYAFTFTADDLNANLLLAMIEAKVEN